MKKLFALILSVTIMCGILSGCSDSVFDPDKPVTLTIWHVYGSNTQSPLNDAIHEFNSTVGKEKGIIVDVTSVTNSSNIDKMLLESLNDEPGAIELPDMFTAYPRIAEKFNAGQLLDWSEYLGENELKIFQEDFLSEGYFGDQLLMLPIAKSSELLYINKTLFDRFAKENDLTEDCFYSIESLMDVCNLYYDWSGGKTMFQINDFYHYFLANMEGFDTDFIINGKINVSSEVFENVFTPVAKAGIYGGLCVDDGYASSRWKTAEVIGNIGSTADILYLRDYVTYEDNATENIEIAVYPYPCVMNAKSNVVLRGGGLFAIKNEEEKKNKAAAEFAKWITEKQHNLDFVTKSGYLPVSNKALEDLFADLSVIENERYRMLYNAVKEQYSSDYNYCSVPLFDGAVDVQSDFEKLIKNTLSAAHNEYIRRINADEDAETVMNELLLFTLSTVREALK